LTATLTPTPTSTPILRDYNRSNNKNVNYTNWGLLRCVVPSNINNWGSP
jgi:hypothetical protein